MMFFYFRKGGIEAKYDHPWSVNSTDHKTLPFEGEKANSFKKEVRI